MTPRESLLVFAAIALLAALISFWRFYGAPADEPPAVPAATLPITVLPTTTPTWQLSGSPITRTLTPVPERILLTPTRTPVPPLVLPPTETPTVQPTETLVPQKSPVQKGERWTRSA